MRYDNEELNKIKELNVGKYLYSTKEKKDDKGNIVHQKIAKCIGLIKDVTNDGMCHLINPLSNAKIDIDILKLNKLIICSSYYLSSKKKK